MKKILIGLSCLLLLPAFARNCTSDLHCDDSNHCTIDTCENSECIYEIQRDCCLKDLDCNDNNPNTADTCVDHICVHDSDIECETDLDCNDNDPGSIDECVNGDCKYTIIEQEPGPAIIAQPESKEPVETPKEPSFYITVMNQLINTLKGILKI